MQSFTFRSLFLGLVLVATACSSKSHAGLLVGSNFHILAVQGTTTIFDEDAVVTDPDRSFVYIPIFDFQLAIDVKPSAVRLVFQNNTFAAQSFGEVVIDLTKLQSDPGTQISGLTLDPASTLSSSATFTPTSLHFDISSVTIPANTISGALYDIEFAPISVPEPSGMLGVTLGTLAVGSCRLRSRRK